MPIYSLDDFEEEMDIKTDKQKFTSSNKHDVSLMEFYVDYLSLVIKKQQGFLSKKMQGDEYKKLIRTVLLIDVKE